LPSAKCARACWRWSFFSTTLNYIDRAAPGIMQSVLVKAMSWTALDYTNINFWF
jgi:MFS transporter, ACS family, hexuronate transporter